MNFAIVSSADSLYIHAAFLNKAIKPFQLFRRAIRICAGQNQGLITIIACFSKFGCRTAYRTLGRYAMTTPDIIVSVEIPIVMTFHIQISAICGMIMFALYTVILFPIRRSLPSKYVTLCSDALVTVVPSIPPDQKPRLD